MDPVISSKRSESASESAVSSVVCVQDADSEDKQGKKSEGAFYVWTAEEVQEVLGQHAELFMAHYYVKPNGNVDLTPRLAHATHFQGP